jgi:hypothetical protein
VQPNRNPESVFRERRQLLGAFGLAGLGLLSSAVAEGSAPRPAAKSEKQPRPKFQVSPPPDDVNDLSMEVAALRTMYLLKASPDQGLPDRNQFNALAFLSRKTAEPHRDRDEAQVSKNYRKVLTDLRAAFIVNHEARIRELSDQLDEVTKDEKPELDDGIEITDAARGVTHRFLLYFDANRTVPYLAAYGKEFPDPFMLLLTSIGAAARSKKPSEDEWPTLRDFVIKEVSWQVGGLSLKKQQQVGEQVAAFLDKANQLSEAELKKGGLPGSKMKHEIGVIVNVVDCTDIMRNVLQQDLAELLSNPRLPAARKARKEYLATIGHWSAGHDDMSQVWTPR